jgi:hypothetical protein
VYFDDDCFGFLQSGNIRLGKDSTIDAPAIRKRELSHAKLFQFQAEQTLAGNDPLHDAARTHLPRWHRVIFKRTADSGQWQSSQ